MNTSDQPHEGPGSPRLPFMQRFMVGDWHVEPMRAQLSWAEQGMLFRLEVSWWVHGQLPIDIGAVSRLTGVPEGNLETLLRDFFPACSGGYRTSRFLAEARRGAAKAYLGRKQHADRLNERSSPETAPVTAAETGAMTGTTTEVEAVKQKSRNAGTQGSTPPTRATSARDRGASLTVLLSEGDVEKFLAQYPNHAGQSVGRTGRALKEAIERGAPWTQLLVAASRYRARVKQAGTEPQFVTRPWTWLSEGRWNDS